MNGLNVPSAPPARASLQVFALPSGDYRREVTGDDLTLLNPCALEYHNGRLYAAEVGGQDGCICVLTPEGSTLQIYDLEWEYIGAMVVFDEKLVVSGVSRDRVPVTEVLWGA